MSDTPAPADESMRFADLALSAPLMQALSDVGYETPSPIQAATIPPLMAGRDVLGQAQTGTGKTAAFALPILSRIDLSRTLPQALVLAPTRELAIQVAEAFQRYATHIKGFHVLPIYGGQSYGPQLAALRRGVHVVVGTPGRVIDHLNRGSLDISTLSTLVLDEADEMLRMGFIDDVETVFAKTPPGRQVALFSATMPAAIRRIAQTHLKDPAEVTIKARTTTATNIRQRYWWVAGVHKLDALTRILEAEPFDAMIIFTRTRHGTEELAEKLTARGFAATAIHGDVQQAQRERAIQRLKDGQIDILVATDVAARGLDVERISHVFNYDIPYDTESYVHRIGRTGRAGRSGEAILFVTPREKGMLRAIERATRQPIEEMQLPSVETVNDQRVGKFLERIDATLASADLSLFRGLVERYQNERNVPALDIAAALAQITQGETPLLLRAERSRPEPGERSERPDRAERPARREAGSTRGDTRAPRPPREKPPFKPADAGMQTYRLEVGHTHGVKPGNIVGAIANEADIESRFIGRIDIRGEYSLIDLPEGLPDPVLTHLKKVWVAGQMLRLRPARAEDMDADGAAAPNRPTARRPGPPRPFSAKPGPKPHRKGPGRS